MKTSKFPFTNKLLIPEEIGEIKTSKLIEKGPIIDFRNPGLISYSPIGIKIINKLRNKFLEGHLNLGGMEIKTPNCMKTETLYEGEEISESFEKKFIKIPEPMGNYMLLTTHEMEILDWLGKDNLSYRSLPLRIFSSKEMIRPIKDPRGILKLREFETILMISLDLKEHEFQESLRDYSTMIESVLRKLNINFQKEIFKGERTISHTNFDVEFFYKTPEGDNLLLGGNKEKAISLAMAYKYKPKSNPVRILNQDNKNIEPITGTYALGLERILYSTLDSCRDSRGFNIPEIIRPFSHSILVFGNSEHLYSKANEIYNSLVSNGKSVLYDDRQRCQRAHKVRLSDYLGIPKKIIVSKSGIREINRD